ncbi:MAG: energy transducer TonB [Pseudobdellovibrionaceae bacterium]
MDTFQYSYFEEKKNDASKFMGCSLVIHVVALFAALYIAVPLMQKPEIETITFEIAGSSTQLAAPREATVRKMPDLQPNIAANLPSSVASDSEPVTASAPVKKEMVQAPLKPAVVAVPNTLDDIEAQDLDTDAKPSAASNINPQLLDEEMENDLLAINRQHKESVAQEKQKLLAKMNAEENENQTALIALEKANAEKKLKLAAANTERRNRERAALAALQAKELADAEAANQQAAIAAAAKAQADRDAAATAAAAKQAELDQAAAQRKQNLAAAASKEGYGNASKNSGNGDVRALTELRQKPGNPRPQYDSSERLQGQQGQVTFLAYIGADGSITKLKTVKLTGYSNLDRKSLEAVKKWKFFPGQEGWVEIPFSWDLKGGPQEMPTLLRRQISRR